MYATETVGVSTVRIACAGTLLEADLAVPEPATGAVVLVHGSGGSRLSSRNVSVAVRLQSLGFATLLLDLLTDAEEANDLRTGRLGFDVQSLAHRLADAVRWLDTIPDLVGLPLGLFGSSTGAAAALVATLELGGRVKAVVSRDGRPDLAADVLPEISAPTLLIVGSRDTTLQRLTGEALGHLAGKVELYEVLGATHLFEEPGAAEAVARVTGEWFSRYLRRRA